MKLVINKCYGGFGLSDKAYERLIELGIPVIKHRGGVRDWSDPVEQIYDRDLDSKPRASYHSKYWEVFFGDNRGHPLLVQVVEELGGEASASMSALEIVDIPDDVDYEIDDYDGIESIHEKHRSW